MIELETKRTIMRQFVADDAEQMFALNADWDVLKYTGDKQYESVEHARAFLASYNQYQKYGLGRLVVLEKSTGEWMGWCGLKHNEPEGEIDIGYRFHKRFWGQGFATETAQRSLEYGFLEQKVELVIGRAMTVNTASINVFRKLGMIYSKPRECGNQEGVLYTITRHQWLKEEAAP